MPNTHDAAVWRSPQTFATTMVVLAMDRYVMPAVARGVGESESPLNWEPLTWLLEIEQDTGVNLSQANFDRLMAGLSLLRNNSFFTSLPEFIRICNILSGSPDQPGVVDLADADECAWGVLEATFLVDPSEDEPIDFHPEIRGYIREILQQEGLFSPPETLVNIIDKPLSSASWDQFSDDPDLTSSIASVSVDRTTEIDKEVKERTEQLQRQLSSLRLSPQHNTALRKWLGE